jgi:hypothetical protein
MNPLGMKGNQLQGDASSPDQMFNCRLYEDYTIAISILAYIHI